MAYKNKDDEREFKRKHYIKNKESVVESNKRRRKQNAKMVRGLKNKPCTDCHTKYPYYVMDFDHREGEEKLYEIAAIAYSTSTNKIIEEINKCDLVCSNCHRKRTHSRIHGSIAGLVSNTNIAN